MDCQVMGIVNVTPDSFSDGGMYFSPKEAVRRARNLAAEGAAVVDLGGESTRPGATPLVWEEEWARLRPVIAELGDVRLSVDTYHPETAARALDMGVKIVNCVYAGPVPAMAELISKYAEAELVVPYRLGSVANPQLPPALASRVYLDPMIGFDTTRDEDLRLLKSVPELSRHGRVLVGASRKRIVKKLTGEKLTGKNLGGNLGIALFAAEAGASMVRVHDVRETVQALKVWNLLR